MSHVETLDLSISSAYPVPEIGPLLAQTVLAGGKRLRPTLCYLMGGIFGVDFAEVTPYARLSEFVHSASLAHDDVLDMADKRRGLPTINVLSSNSQAVLAGDFLVSRVFRELSELGAFALIRDLSSVMENLVYGEWLQEQSRYNTAVTAKTLRQVAEFKTASLIGWCCMVPARMRSLDQGVVELCRDVGISLGIGFQLVDDVIDYDPAGEKDFARDLKNGFINFVTWELIQHHPELVPQLKKFLHGEEVPSVDWQVQAVNAARDRVRQSAIDELKLAKRKLEKLMELVHGENAAENPCAQSLIELIDMMGIRSF